VGGVDGDWLSAVGDVNHRALLTHQGKYQARIVGNAIGVRTAGQPLDTRAWGAHTTTADSHAVPQVVFSDPEAAAVGLSAEAVQRAGHRIRVVDVELADVVIGALLYADGYQGRARMVLDCDHEYLLGVTLVGPSSGTPCRVSPRSARSGCACSRPTETDQHRPEQAKQAGGNNSTPHQAIEGPDGKPATTTSLSLTDVGAGPEGVITVTANGYKRR
jgi:hypothetical protein